MCPEIFNLWFIAERMLDGAPAHFSRGVRDVLNNMTNRELEEDPLHGFHARQIWIFWIFVSEDTYNPLCMQLLLTTKRHFTNAIWTPVRLSSTTPAALNGCDGPWWDVSRLAVNLMEDILGSYYNCTLSAITHKLNVSWHGDDMDIFSCFGMWTRAHSLSAPFTFTLYNVEQCCWKTSVFAIPSFTSHIRPWQYCCNSSVSDYTWRLLD
jgi:hypothetical protein